MENQKASVEEAENILKDAGLTVAQFVQLLGKKNSSVLKLSNEQQKQFQILYDEIDSDCLDKEQKGKKLEEITSLLFSSSKGNFFECRRNCRTSSNEIDLLLTWNEDARMEHINESFPCFGDTFLCECKNYDRKVGVTYVGKFYSLLSLASAKLGIMVSWNGIAGRGKWDAARGLVKKIALKDEIFIVVLDKDDLKEIYDEKKNIYSLVYDKYNALKNDIDFSTYILKHPAEDDLMLRESSN